MLSFTPTSFADALAAAATTQTSWSNALVTALGSSRQVVCTRNGTEFYRANLTGTMTVTGGKITYLGATSGVVTNLAADLSTGTCVLRIEGNGKVVNASLGLAGSGADYTLSANPDGVSGLGFSPSASLGSYAFLPTGVGPAAPARTEFMASRIKLWNWTNPASPVLVGTLEIDSRKADWVCQDAEMAAVYGDVGRYHSSAPLVWGNYSITAKMTVSDKSHGESGVAPFQTVRIRWAYNWPGFPENTNYNKSTMLLNPPPFKATVHDSHDNLLYTHEWPGGKPINDPSFPQSTLGTGGNINRAWSATSPSYPRFDVGQVLIWKSEPSAVSPLAPKFFTGLRNYRPSMAKSRLSCNPVVPTITGGYGGYGANGLAHFFYLPKYPQPFVTRTLTDPYLDVVMNNPGASSQYNGWAEGYGYMAGGLGGADGYTAPGGGRFDRTVYPAAAIMALQYPGQSRLQDNTPWKEMAHEWLLNSYNYGLHWTVPKAEVMAGQWGFRGMYYGDPSTKTRKEIQINGNQRDGDTSANFDASGVMVMAGRAIDPLHNYRQVGLLAMLYMSPDLLEEAYYDFANSLMVHGVAVPNSDMRETYMIRAMAWQWLSFVIAWKCGTLNAEGFSQQDVEGLFSNLLEATYNSVDKPVFVTNEQSAFCNSIRNLGTPFKTADQGGFYITSGGGGRLFFYMSDVLLLFKQTGFWSKMYGKGGNGATSMRNLIRNMDLFCYDQILDTNGDASGGYTGAGDGVNYTTLPTSWANQWATQQAGGGPELVNDFIHITDIYATGGTAYGVYKANSDHSSNTFESYPYMRRDFFPEFAHPRLAAAITKFQGYEDTVATIVTNSATPQLKMTNDYIYRVPGLSPKLPPASGLLGPT